jgi:hypothetical protein
VGVAAGNDRDDRDSHLRFIDSVDDPVRAASCAVSVCQRRLQSLADSLRLSSNAPTMNS